MAWAPRRLPHTPRSSIMEDCCSLLVSVCGLLGLLSIILLCVLIGAWAGSAVTARVQWTAGMAAGLLNATLTANCVADALRQPPHGTAALLQVGAHLAWLNDNDQLGLLKHEKSSFREAGAVALLVEPQPHVFRQLAAAVKAHAPHVRAVHAAACARDSGMNVTFYALSKSIDPRTGFLHDAHSGLSVQLPAWASQVASLSRQAVLRSLPGGEQHRAMLSRYIQPVRVRCDSIATTLSRQGLLAGRSLRVLAIDAEGHDSELVLSLGHALGDGGTKGTLLSGLSLVLFEHKHSQPEPLCNALRMLDRAGFSCECDLTNVRCVRTRGRAMLHADRSTSTFPQVCHDLSLWPEDDPWSTCVNGGHLSALRGFCLHRPFWVWSRWQVRHEAHEPPRSSG